MSTTETTEQTALLCPGCAGPIETTQTICDVCRSGLEEQVLAVRAADYPSLFQNVVRNSAELRRSPVDPTSLDMLKVAENTSDDLDLVPLVPMDEPRRAGSSPGNSAADSVPLSPVMAAATPLAASSAPTVAPSPVARPSQTIYMPPSAPRLEPSSRWKHVVVAVVGLAAAAGLAALLWSVLVPTRPADPDDKPVVQPSPSAKPATK